MDWMLVKDSWTREPIGAIGFIGDEAAVIASFHEDKDFNQDGSVAAAERVFTSLFSMKGRAAAKVASHAYADPDILMRDPGLGALRGKILTQFASGLVADGIYAAYFSMGVSKAAGALAGSISKSAIKSFIIKKGMESAVKNTYRAAVQ